MNKMNCTPMNSSSISGFSGGAGDDSSGEFAANETEMGFFRRWSFTMFPRFPVAEDNSRGRSDKAVKLKEAIVDFTI